VGRRGRECGQYRALDGAGGGAARGAGGVDDCEEESEGRDLDDCAGGGGVVWGYVCHFWPGRDVGRMRC